MIECINESKYSRNISHVSVDVSSAVKHITQDKNGTMASVSACEEDFACSLSKCACECYKDCEISKYF